MGVRADRMAARVPCQTLVAAALVAVFAGTVFPWLGETAYAAAPAPPPARGLAAARHAVASRAAAAGRAADRFAAAQARLSQLEARAETLTERYDGAIVELRRSTGAYRIAQGRYAAAMRAEAARRAAVAELASAAYETNGGLGSMAAMIGGPGGPQAFFDRAGVLGVLAEHDTDILASAAAGRIVAQVFRGQARDALLAAQASAREAGELKLAVLAAVARQQSVLRSTRATRDRLVRELATAKANEGAMELAAARQASPAVGPLRSSGAAPAWAYASSAAGASAGAGDLAANWALGQLGRPYVWAAAGPYSFDCSGLSMRAWQRAGVQLDHWTGTQWTSGPHIAIDQLRRGDLVFFANDTSDPNTIHHVGIYIGHDMMVDAPYTGVDVRIDSIFEPGLIGATRPAA
jgi:cell wall-associated NlpC family hydrolase